jgi:hypothetical protein
MKTNPSRDAIKNVIDIAIKNFYKPQVIDTLMTWFNNCEEKINSYDLVYFNDDENVDMLLHGKTPSEILRSINGVIKNYDAFIKFDGYGNLYSFHYDYFLDTFIKDNNDLIDYILENVSVKELNKLNALSLTMKYLKRF